MATTAMPAKASVIFSRSIRTGKLLADVILGEGTIYHPGGIDYDGRDIWVPVAEYRPNSRSIVYRVDPQSMKATEVFRSADHIGGIVHDTEDQTLHGVSWGSRRFYRWKLDGRKVARRDVSRRSDRGRADSSHYVDYQDCKYAGQHRMLCTGVAELRQAATAPFRSAASIWSTCATAGRCTRCRSLSGRRAVWT